MGNIEFEYRDKNCSAEHDRYPDTTIKSESSTFSTVECLLKLLKKNCPFYHLNNPAKECE